MSKDLARIRILFISGLVSLFFPAMALLDTARRGGWMVLTGLAYLAAVAGSGWIVLRTTADADDESPDTKGLVGADGLVDAIDSDSDAGALAVFDLDDFAQLNQTIGSANGDEVLRLIADRIIDASRDSDVAARLGADRFALFLKGIDDEQTAADVVTRLLGRFFEPASVAGLDLDLAASAGLAMVEGDVDGSTALKQASIALESAKKASTQLQMYRPAHDGQPAEAVTMIAQVRHAIERREFEPYFQPVVDTVTGQTLGLEALVRWVHPEQGFIPPGVFLGQIEHLPVGRDFTNYMLRESIAALAELPNADIGLSVNLSTRDVQDLDLPMVVWSLLDEFGIEPRRLTLELPESVGSMSHPRVEQVLMNLRDLGCGIAIDDFGSRSVPIEFLASLPVTELKVASQFTQACIDDPSAQLVIRHVVGLANSGSVAVTAKGVERQAVLEKLIELGCHAAQGFHIAHPMPVGETAAWLRTTRTYV